MHDDGAVHAPVSDGEFSIFSTEGAMRNIAFGSFAGMVSEVFEYPFDLAKVRLQAQLLSSSSQLRFNGPMDCLKRTWNDEGIRGLYRGLPAPIVGSMAETAALFLAYSSFQNVIRAYSVGGRTYTDSTRPPPLSIPQLTMAAAGAGFVTSFILTPIELVKCKMQVQLMNIPPPPAQAYRRSVSAIIPPIRFLPPSISTSSPTPTLNFFSNSHHTTPNLYLHQPRTSHLHVPGAFSIVRSTIQTYGLRGLWLGHTGTLVRETGGTAAWFAVKELVAAALQNRRLPLVEPVAASQAAREAAGLRPWESALAGAVAGAACVLAFYPADTVKSAIQTEDELRAPSARGSGSGMGRPSSSRTFFGTLARMYAVHGIKGLYAGCGMTVARAVPSSGIVFVVYDGLSTWLG